MASMAMTIPLQLHQFRNQYSKHFIARSLHQPLLTGQSIRSTNLCTIEQNLFGRLPRPCNAYEGVPKCLCKPISAVDSGLEASITGPNDKAITVKNAKIVVESQHEDKIQLRVDLAGDETQKVFDKVLANLARSAPPIPGFRRTKGGKTSKVPKSFLLQILGEERVTKFVIQEIVNSTMADYVDKENLTVKEKKVNTTQTAEELKSSFSPGNKFGFNAIIELEKPESGTATPTLSASEM